MRYEPVTLTLDTLVMKGEIILPDGDGPHPAVLLIHNAFGLGDQVRDAARLLAADGFVALMCDIYGNGFYSEDSTAIAKVITPLWSNSDLLRQRTNAWFNHLQSHDAVDASHVSVIGYCFGGSCALELARSGTDAKVVVSFHGILPTTQPAERDAIRAHVAIYTGGRDPHVPASHVAAFREEMIAADAAWQITEYGNAYHAFTDPAANDPEQGRAYDRLSHQLAWNSAIRLIKS